MTTGTGAHAYAGPVTMLYSWLRRHPKVLDGGLAAVLAFLGTASTVVTVFHARTTMFPGQLVGIPVGLAIAVPVIFRRAHPVGAFAAAILFGAIQVLFNIRPNVADMAIVILLYTLAAYSPRRSSVIGLGICLIGWAAEVVRWVPQRGSAAGRAGFGSIMFAGPSLIAWVLGDSMRYRRGYYTSLEERAARLEARARRPGEDRRRRRTGQDRPRAARRGRAQRQRHGGPGRRRRLRAGSDPDRAREALAAISAPAGRR